MFEIKPKENQNLQTKNSKKSKKSSRLLAFERMFLGFSLLLPGNPMMRLRKKQVKKYFLTFLDLHDGFSSFPAGSREDF